MKDNSYYSNKINSIIPGGAHTYSRGDDQFPINAPAILNKGKGAYVWSFNKKKYLDYGMGLRSVTLGYSNPIINKSVFSIVDKKSFSIIEIWNNLINESKLYGFESLNDFKHITDIEIFNKLLKNQ